MPPPTFPPLPTRSPRSAFCCRRLSPPSSFHVVISGLSHSPAAHATRARPFDVVSTVHHRYRSSFSYPRSPPLGLLTPQGDGTGLSGCPQGLVPEWPVLHLLAPNARQLSLIGHSHVNVSLSYCISNVLHTKYLRSFSHRPTLRSTSASRSTKPSPSLRASSRWRSCAATTTKRNASRWRLLSCLVRTH